MHLRSDPGSPCICPRYPDWNGSCMWLLICRDKEQQGIWLYICLILLACFLFFALSAPRLVQAKETSKSKTLHTLTWERCLFFCAHKGRSVCLIYKIKRRSKALGKPNLYFYLLHGPKRPIAPESLSAVGRHMRVHVVVPPSPCQRQLKCQVVKWVAIYAAPSRAPA